MTLAELIKEWYEHYARTVSEDTAQKTQDYLDRYLSNQLLQLDINDIKPKNILDLSVMVAETSTFYARRIVSDIARIYDYAVVMQYVGNNPASRLDKYKPKHTCTGFNYILPNKIAILLKKIDMDDSSTLSVKMAFWTIVYTAVRRGEAVNALKSEFDFNNQTWTIPSHRMKIKGNGEHTVYLAPQVAKMLKDFFATNDSIYAFPNRKLTTPIATWSPYFVLKKLGYQKKQTLHGFRKLFSTHAHESGLWTIDSIELSLAHKIGGVRGIYNHAKMADERQRLAIWYANEVDKWRGVKS